MKHFSKRYPTRIGIYTQRIVEPVFKVRGLMEGKIISNWSKIVGDRYSELSLAEAITFPKGKKTEGTLHLNVTSAGAMLIHYSQDLILEQVNTFFGYKALTKLRLTHGFIPPKETEQKCQIRSLNEDEEKWILLQVNKISDPQLRECLSNLGSSLMRS